MEDGYAGTADPEPAPSKDWPRQRIDAGHRKPMAITLRRATADDLPRLEAWSYAFERDGEHFASGDPGPPFIGETLRHFAVEPSRGEIVVLERAGRPAGYAILVFFWSNEFRGEVVLLDELWIDPAERGGTGGQVMTALQERAAARGAQVLTLEVLDAVPRAASLYRRAGFTSERRSWWRRLEVSTERASDPAAEPPTS